EIARTPAVSAATANRSVPHLYGRQAPIHRRCSMASAYMAVPQGLLPQSRFHWISRQEAGSCRVRSQQIVELSRQPLDPARQSFCDARELFASPHVEGPAATWIHRLAEPFAKLPNRIGVCSSEWIFEAGPSA